MINLTACCAAVLLSCSDQFWADWIPVKRLCWWQVGWGTGQMQIYCFFAYSFKINMFCDLSSDFFFQNIIFSKWEQQSGSTISLMHQQLPHANRQIHSAFIAVCERHARILWNQLGEQRPCHSISWRILLAVKAACICDCKHFECNFLGFFFLSFQQVCILHLLGVFT